MMANEYSATTSAIKDRLGRNRSIGTRQKPIEDTRLAHCRLHFQHPVGTSGIPLMSCLDV
jgi:hypothetical protein